MIGTVVAQLTPPGKAAVAVVGIAGPHAWEMVRSQFRRPDDRELPEVAEAGATFFGRFGGGAGASDEVILFVRSTAPEPVLEISCHGGSEVLRFLVARLEAGGAVAADAEEWQRRHLDRDQAEAQAILSRCTTLRCAAIALDYLQGSFRRSLAELERETTTCDKGAAQRRLARLRELMPVGEHLDRPWRVVLAGAPNVGKSSLANAIAGYQRSLVAPTPGTTRDVVTSSTALDGWPVELADTAGVRFTSEAIEAEGVDRARAAAAAADLVVWIVDGSVAPTWRSDALTASLTVINKVDLPPAWDWSTTGARRVSARAGDGVPELCQAIADSLVPAPPAPGEAVPVTASSRETVRAMHG